MRVYEAVLRVRVDWRYLDQLEPVQFGMDKGVPLMFQPPATVTDINSFLVWAAEVSTLAWAPVTKTGSLRYTVTWPAGTIIPNNRYYRALGVAGTKGTTPEIISEFELGAEPRAIYLMVEGIRVHSIGGSRGDFSSNRDRFPLMLTSGCPSGYRTALSQDSYSRFIRFEREHDLSQYPLVLVDEVFGPLDESMVKGCRLTMTYQLLEQGDQIMTLPA